MDRKKLIQMLMAAMFLSLGLVLPFLTSQIKEIGDTLLPMHFPVMLCGFICGPWYGLTVGFITPLLRGLCFGMPPVYPSGVWMAFELATYGFVTGILYTKIKRRNIGYTYICLIAAMLAGRVVWGIVKAIILGAGGSAFTVSAFITGGFIDAFPGILLQLVLVPLIVTVIQKAKKDLHS